MLSIQLEKTKEAGPARPFFAAMSAVFFPVDAFEWGLPSATTGTLGHTWVLFGIHDIVHAQYHVRRQRRSRPCSEGSAY